jgi:hypothetical protein
VASELLSDPAFQQQVGNVVTRANASRMVAGEQALASSGAWNRFLASLPQSERQKIRNTGITAWLTASEEPEKAE